MLFNSISFIFVFLPLALLGYFLSGRLSGTFAVAWLALASLVFYAFSGIELLPLLIGSIAFNYVVGLVIIRAASSSFRRAALIVGVTSDLALLGYFKYGGFFVANLDAALSTQWHLDVVLPVGISFYTFTQIAFLVDAYCGQVARYALPQYALFVTYFPHLIAGPILHHKDMIPQFERRAAQRLDVHLILYGLIIFGIGLFKKTCLADSIQPFVALAFGPSSPTFVQAWLGALAYTFQLYFDFSGYSDMAIGISLMFGIFLPLNFNSPYKAVNIVDFWRRWHMTLSQFLRDYLYIPLGGNRRGPALRYVNLMLTMVLGGLWHGAAWTFAVWGALHGFYLCVNHAWSRFGPSAPAQMRPITQLASRLLTVLCVVVAWVLFRADGVGSALAILSRMAIPAFSPIGSTETIALMFIAVYAAIVWFAPNTQEIVGYDHEQRRTGLASGAWSRRPSLVYAAGAMLAFGVLGIQSHSEFIYFRF